MRSTSTMLTRPYRATLRRSRGMAMLLVLIALAMATIVTSAYLASRDNSTAISENITSAAASRWAADSGLEVAVAILQTETAWYDAMTGDILLDDYVIDEAVVDVSVLDLETGDPPTVDTSFVQLTATATANGVKQTATATAEIPHAGDDVVDLDLSEFAVFASEKIKMSDNSTITRWPTAPKSVLGQPVLLGTSGTNSATVELGGDALAVDSQVYHPPGASDSLVTVANGSGLGKQELPDAVPLLDCPDVPVPEPSGGDGEDGGLPVIRVPIEIHYPLPLNTDFRFDRLVTREHSNGHIELIGDITITTENEMRIDDDTELIVSGEATLVVFGNFEIESDAAIILSDDDSRLTVHVMGDVKVEDAYVGDQSSMAQRAVDGSAPWMNPDRVMIYSHKDGGQIQLRGATVFKGSVYAPRTGIVLDDKAALYGRVAAERVELKKESAIFYDPALNTGGGYTATKSAIYAEDGSYRAFIYSVYDLSDDALSAVAASEGVKVATPKGQVYGTDGALSASPGAAADVPKPGVATDRPKDVPMKRTAFGSSVTSWEDRAQ